jgi:hypothetical protein
MPAAQTEPALALAKVDKESALREAVAGCRHDPFAYVLSAFNWGQGQLSKFKGPDRWQAEELAWLTQQLKTDPTRLIRAADAAAHGVGKTTKLSWLLKWGMDTFPGCRARVTAGTEAQLHSILRPEFRFWHEASLTRHWWDLKAETMKSLASGWEDNWRLDFMTWDEHNPEAFAGLHAQGRRIIYAVDEASQTPQSIYDTIEGALTDKGTERLFLTASNTTRCEGPYYESIEGKTRSRWHVRRITYEDSDLTDKEEAERTIADLGADHDFCSVRYFARFPRQSIQAFISRADVDEAIKREPVSNEFDPLIMGVDVAAGGEDESVIAFRRGFDARSIPWVMLRISDTMQLASRVAEIVEREKPDGVIVDATGLGLGVYHRLLQLNVGLACTLVGVNFGAAPIGFAPYGERVRCANRCVEMYAGLRGWLKHGTLPNDPQLRAELTGRQYAYRANGTMELERKKDMKRRGLSSPDRADSIALTFAEQITRRNPYADEQQFYETQYSTFHDDRR